MIDKKPLFDRVGLIGLGLIGSSLAWAMKRGGLAGHISGYARSEKTRARSMELGFLDSVHDSAAACATECDLVILCTPLGVYGQIGTEIGPVLKAGAIVSDAGSTKVSVIDALTPVLPEGVHLVPGHPVAGTENSGPDAGFETLFDGRYCILTPVQGVPQHAVDRVRAFWEACGSMVEVMDAEHHDRVLAITSHLPHLIAYTIVGTASDLEGQLAREKADETEMVKTSDVIRFSAGGFRDFTRIAGSDPVMWRDVFLNNREAVLEMLGRFSEDLVALQRAVRWSDGDKLEDWFTRTREIRRGIVEQKQAGTFIAVETTDDD